MASIRFEVVGTDTIERNCTDWPRCVRQLSLLIFQGLDIAGKERQEKDGAVPIADAGDGGVLRKGPGDHANVVLYDEPYGRKTRLSMAFSKHRSLML
jgi:hypothetical protein